jgi:beta-lactamase regulating signal transducer with metallopeptidase domain
MTAVFEWALTNSLLALALAIPAYASAWLRRPAITHALWLLVLVRLIMPPVWHVPVTYGTTAKTTDPISLIPAAPISDSIETTIPDIEETTFVPESVPEEPVTTASDVPAAKTWNWQLPVGILWSVGAVGCVMLALGRALGFRRLLRHTKAAPAEWYLEAAPIAQRLGLKRLPSIRLMPGSVAPLLWAGFGRPVLLLPAQLAASIDAERRAGLIAHELAHWRRGDYLVRWLEIAVTALIWWNPLVWLARRELREAEELLCDAWVVWVLPDARRAYAAALVDTVEYLSERTPLRPALPPLASGFGEVQNLKRRIVMIMNGRGARRLTPLSLALGLSLGACLLAITPGRASDEPEQPPVPPTPPAAPRTVEGQPGRRNLDPEQAEEADKLRQSMRRLHEQLQRMEARLAEIEGRPAPRAVPGRRAPADAAPLPPLPPGQNANPDNRPRGFGGNFGGFPGGPGAGGFGGGGGVGGAPPAGGPGSGGAFGGGMGGFGGGAPFGGAQPNVERRMEEMQRAIEQMGRELSEMRRFIQDQQPRGRPPARGDNRPGPGAGGPTTPAAPTPPPSPSTARP